MAPASTTSCLFVPGPGYNQPATKLARAKERTRVCHVQQGTNCVALNSHILRTSDSCEMRKGIGLGNYGLVIIYRQSSDRLASYRSRTYHV